MPVIEMHKLSHSNTTRIGHQSTTQLQIFENEKKKQPVVDWNLEKSLEQLQVNHQGMRIWRTITGALPSTLSQEHTGLVSYDLIFLSAKGATDTVTFAAAANSSSEAKKLHRAMTKVV